MTFIVATFYHFFDFADHAARRAELLALLKARDIKGSLLIAAEGINGTLSGTRENIDAVLDYLKKEITGAKFEHKESPSDRQPFGRAKVRLKKEIISLGEPTPSLTLPPSGRGDDPNLRRNSISPLPRSGGGSGRGAYIEPGDWNALIADPDTLVLDARNAYEVHLGTFERAINPHIKNFKQLPGFVRKNIDRASHKNIATFCTGGIRCEKFSAWLIAQGFENVYQLKGGILKYLEEIPESESKWNGECYVFDERVAVGHGLAPSSTATMCPTCGHALTAEDRKHSLYMEGKSCGFCEDRA